MTTPSSPRTRVALLLACGGLALNGLVLGPIWLLTPSETFSGTVAVPAFALSQRISWVLLTTLVVLLPAVLVTGHRGTPPAWLGPLAQVAVAAQAATAFVMGFVAPWLAGVAPFTLDVPGGTFQVAMTAVWVGFMLAMLMVAVSLWRAGHSRLGAALALLGAVVTPGVGPVGSGVMAFGLGLVALGQLRAAHRRPFSPSLERTAT